MIHLTPNLAVDNDFVSKYDSYLSRGLSHGLGDRDGQMCIEAAICASLGLPHSDDPKCVAESVRDYKISLNDSPWSSPEARAKGLRDLGLAQLGSLGVVDDDLFVESLLEKHIRVLVPSLFREKATHIKSANRCEYEGNLGALEAVLCEIEPVNYYCRLSVASLRSAAKSHTSTQKASYIALSAKNADYNSDPPDKYLLLSAKLALETLKELGSPGCKLL